MIGKASLPSRFFPHLYNMKPLKESWIYTSEYWLRLKASSRKSKIVCLLKYSLAKSELFVLVCLHGHQIFSSPLPSVAFLSFRSSFLRWGGQIDYRKHAFNLMSGVVIRECGKEVAKGSIWFVLAWSRWAVLLSFLEAFSGILPELLQSSLLTICVTRTVKLSLGSFCFPDVRSRLL